MNEDSPRAKPLAVLIMLGALAALVWLRYKEGFLPEKEWQALHIVMGLSVCALVMVLFHGFEVIRRVRWQTWAVVLTGILFFCGFWYLGRMDAFYRWFQPWFDRSDEYYRVYPFIYFSMGSLFFRLIVPFAFAWLILKQRPGELGLHAGYNSKAPAVRRIWPVYLILFLAMLPFLFQVAETEVFQRKYPLSRAMITPEGEIALEHFMTYEIAYLFIFVAGEAFWRGYLSFGTERDLGLYGLVFMVVPYVTAHFGKPYAETMGAIAAGLVLGFLALKHRSVWLGVALHYAVALSMDLLAVRANGFVID